MYGQDSFQVKYRRKIFEEVAKLAYAEGDERQMKWLPQEIVTEMGSIPTQEAISSDLDYASEACMVAMGLEPWDYKAVLKGEKHAMDSALTVSKDAPLLSVMKSTCHKCSGISGDKRPCAASCERNAIGVDSMGRTMIDPEKCNSCGRCLEACPYGAITDKSCIFQLIHAIRSGEDVHALLIPDFAEQFSEICPKEQLYAAFCLLGFTDVSETAVMPNFADLLPKAKEQAKSYCPAWRSDLPKHHAFCVAGVNNITAAISKAIEIIKNACPGSKVALIVPCVPRKLEGLRKSFEYHVDYVLTFDEILGMFDARGIQPDLLRPKDANELIHV